MNPLQLAKLGFAARRAFRNWRQRKRNLELAGQETRMLKGKLTYTAVIALALQLVGQWSGVDVAPTEVEVLVGAATVLVALYGRWRATR